MKKNLLRLTRSSYKRKLIMFGVSIFTSLALTATGFAAWVLSQDATGNLDGNVEIGAIEEANIEIEDLTFVDGLDSFIFEPQESDVSGRVRNDGENFESLTVSISWSLTNYQSVGDVYVDLKIPSTVKAAIDANYITLPEGLTYVTTGDEDETLKTETIQIGEKQVTYYIARYTIASSLNLSGEGNLSISGSDTDFGTYNVTTDTQDTSVKDAAFTANLTFGWGSAFNHKNPGVYYDSNAAGDGADTDYNTVKATLLQLKYALHGLQYSSAELDKTETQLEQLYAANPAPGYYILVTAKVK